MLEFIITMANIAFIKIPLAILGLFIVVLMWFLAFSILYYILICLYNIYRWLFGKKNNNV